MAARKFGKIYEMSKKFEDYSYIINGVGGIGKTTMVHDIGYYVTGSHEGTFIITCGAENTPKHIPYAFGDVAHTADECIEIVEELCTNKEAYPNTRFVAIDSLDEFTRIFEKYVVKEWNKNCNIDERAKSIAQAYKGFQKGENRACDIMLSILMRLQQSGYSLLLIGHTKTKAKSDVITQVQYEQLTCNLDNKYYNAFKDKVNLVAMCYYENVIENVTTKKNAFTKKMDKVGDLVDRKRVMVFADDDNAIDCKSHFEYIDHKIDFDAKLFVDSVENAIQMKIDASNGLDVKKPMTLSEINKKEEDEVKEANEKEAVNFDEVIDHDSTEDDESVELFEEPNEPSLTDLKKEVRDFVRKNPDMSEKIKDIMKEHNVRSMSKIDDPEILKEMLSLE